MACKNLPGHHQHDRRGRPKIEIVVAAIEGGVPQSVTAVGRRIVRVGKRQQFGLRLERKMGVACQKSVYEIFIVMPGVVAVVVPHGDAVGGAKIEPGAEQPREGASEAVAAEAARHDEVEGAENSRGCAMASALLQAENEPFVRPFAIPSPRLMSLPSRNCPVVGPACVDE